MTNQQSAADGTLGEQELAWLQRRAEGGFGVVTTCAVHVSRTGQGWPNELGAWGEQHLPGLTRLAGAIGKAGALGLVQLFHGGARCPTALTGVRPVSAVISPRRPGGSNRRAGAASRSTAPTATCWRSSCRGATTTARTAGVATSPGAPGC